MEDLKQELRLLKHSIIDVGTLMHRSLKDENLDLERVSKNLRFLSEYIADVEQKISELKTKQKVNQTLINHVKSTTWNNV